MFSGANAGGRWKGLPDEQGLGRLTLDEDSRSGGSVGYRRNGWMLQANETRA